MYLAAYIGSGHSTQCPKNVAAAQIAAILPHRFSFLPCSSPTSPRSTSRSSSASLPDASMSNASRSFRKSAQS